MRPDEQMKMSATVSLIMRSGFSPIKAQQYIWYQEPVMHERLLPAVSIPKQTAQQRPFVRSKERAQISVTRYID